MKRLIITIYISLGLAYGIFAVGWSDIHKGDDAIRQGDYATALKEWKPLAEQGHAQAQGLLGMIYHFGLGVPQDYYKALKWYTLSAEQGFTPSQFELGQFYHFGDGVLQDYKAAVKWYTLSAEQGEVRA